ncbi:hypothetical protein BROUX41_001587 [Berkeleyomyces rouxiae]|uniref:uncharacterized protein n=1 Tax=Berkeleyomyces rouxiae TaxID=2035830 RepID=UPI003B77D649
MAQSVKKAASGTAGPYVKLSETEKHQLRQYQKIIDLRDVVLSGNHPRIKIPARLAGKVPPPQAVASPVLLQSQPSALSSAAAPVAPLALATASTTVPKASGQAATDAQEPTPVSKPSDSANPNMEINPILLEKSGDLIRAEFKVRRQRIENGLRDELETKRLANKSSILPENPLNIGEIYESAQKLVAAADASVSASANATDAATATSNPVPLVDSPSEASYYSSRHDTPESEGGQPMSIDDAVSVGDPAHSKSVMSAATPAPSAPAPASAAATSVVTADSTTAQPPTVTSNFPPPCSPISPSMPLRHSLHEARVSSLQAPAGLSTGPHSNQELDSLAAGAGNGPDSVVRTRVHGDPCYRQVEVEIDRVPDPMPAAPVHYQRTRRVYDDQDLPPSIVRSHNLVPAAPQPHHVSALATQGGRQTVEASLISPTQHEQVVSSHKEISSGSAGTSPKNHNKQRRNKGKKRKQDRAEEATITTIKMEPKSPEPMKTPQYAPRKRQRGKRNYVSAEEEGAQYSPRNPLAAGSFNRDRSQHRAPDHHVAHGDLEVYRRRGVDPTHERVYVESGALAPRPPQYVRPGYTLYNMEDHYAIERPVSRYYREGHEATPRHEVETRATSPIIVDAEPAAMGPPRAPGSLVVVDAYGRSYYEPPRPGYPRQPYYGDEIVYKRPGRAVSRRPTEYYDDGSVYQRVSPGPYLSGTRRVVTQPELVDNEVRRREYSAWPSGPPAVDDYVSVRATPVERRAYEDPVPYNRPVSVRPLDGGSFTSIAPPPPQPQPQPSAHVLANPGFHRMTSVRPPEASDAAGQSRHYISPAGVAGRSYSVVPGDRVQRHYSVRPEAERYYADGVEYVERAPGPGGAAYGEAMYRR